MSIAAIIEEFEGVTLDQMDSVKLMNRTDRKFWFNIDHLEGLLADIKDHYYVLEINGERNLPYSTTYYDTLDDRMYIDHHRGKLNRFKIRRRSYLSTGSSFLEIKFKSNKGRTIKQRQESPYNSNSFDEGEDRFISTNTPYQSGELKEVLVNSFRRLMLVGKEMNERCTIDQELAFVSNGVSAKVERLVVVEVKSEGHAPSVIITAMNQKRLKSSGFSKYCMGRSITDSELKHNLFKLKHRMIERQISNKLENLLTII